MTEAGPARASAALDVRNTGDAGLRDRLASAKAAYVTRRIDPGGATSLLSEGVRPKDGDLLLARVESIGQHRRLELTSGRRATLHVGDEILVCYGSRYAPDQFEAYLPDDLGACDLVAAGGIASTAVNRHTRIKKATRILPIGIVADRSGKAVNLRQFSIPRTEVPHLETPVITVVGSSMNAGKTTTAAALIRGFLSRGQHVAAAKVTGTGAGGDRWTMLDAGARTVLDFSDAGAPSTFGLDAREIESIFLALLSELGRARPDVIVLEVADGLCQRETAELVRSNIFKSHIDGVFFAGADALGSAAGVRFLEESGVDVLGISGAVTASPLAIRELEAMVSVP
ncbi:MAG: DUF1611 domain-containing protein, partial [Proteobacteria bacterium]